MQLFRGLIGSGIYLMPFALLLDFLILLFHDGRPVRLRVACSFVVVLCVGMLVHLFGCKEEIPWGFPMMVQLWHTGVEGTSGGVLAGFLAMLFALCIHKVGAVILCLIIMVLAGLAAFNMSVGSVITAIRNRPRAEYDAPVREHRDTAEVIVNHVTTKQIERTERKRAGISEFDLEVDDPPAVKKPAKKSNKKEKEDPFLENLKQAEELVAVTENTTDVEHEEAEEDLVIDSKRRFEEAAARAVQEQPPLVVKKETKQEPEGVEELLPLDPDMPQKVKKEEAQQEAMKIASEIAQAEDQPKPYTFPALRLLKEGNGKTVDGTEEMQLNADRINNTLASFGIDAHIINVIRGSSITRYELELDRGVKLSKITNLADDIALALGASGVRISAIPDKISVVGIEVPNKLVSTVHIHEVISSPEFGNSKSKISFSVGKDISGKCVVGDIAKLPHMLIAGTTGSGKSVCMNSLIISLLYKAKPEEVRLIMVDPKMVELGIYNGIPHLLIPVVTDPKKAAGALQWAVTEMMKRYRLMADAGVRDLESYNKTCGMEEGREKLPQIVVVIDELADLMLVAAKEVEESICRVAQMGRASGIHLVIATQRPSADVITGLMKANIPSRIAFAVASAMESRIILDTAGAEKLVGKGDMLYAPLGQGKPKRVQGCFITDDEVQDVVEFIKKNATASYDNDIMNEINKTAEQSGKSGGSSGVSNVEADASADGDELLPAAVEVFLETGQGSVSMLQRRLKLGYARAARIVDEMEEKGIVGPFEGSKPRQILITKEQWLQMQGIEPETPAEDGEPVEEEEP
ncbi:MAG: DNA translocase FtsK [Oscillospiraceae bacterium]|nr:DNA translocase FtsK [Oscillospiraceae bacterium]